MSQATNRMYASVHLVVVVVVELKLVGVSLCVQFLFKVVVPNEGVSLLFCWWHLGNEIICRGDDGWWRFGRHRSNESRLMVVDFGWFVGSFSMVQFS